MSSLVREEQHLSEVGGEDPAADGGPCAEVKHGGGC